MYPLSLFNFLFGYELSFSNIDRTYTLDLDDVVDKAVFNLQYSSSNS
jgi:transposase